jgi:hypothetical protein
MERSGILFRLSPLLGVLAVACGTPTASESDAVMSLEVVPDTVLPGDFLEAVFILVNPTPHPMKLTVSSTCLTQIGAYRDTRRVDLQGASILCGDRITELIVAPRDSLVDVYSLRARLRATVPPYAYAVPPPAGTYTLRVAPGWDSPYLEAEFEVQEAGGAT